MQQCLCEEVIHQTETDVTRCAVGMTCWRPLHVGNTKGQGIDIQLHILSGHKKLP